MEWQIKEKKMQKLKDLVNADIELNKKYENIEDMPEEEYQNFRKQREDFVKETGLTENELTLLTKLRQYKLTTAINCLIFRIVEQLEKSGAQPTADYSEITGYKDILLL